MYRIDLQNDQAHTRGGGVIWGLFKPLLPSPFGSEKLFLWGGGGVALLFCFSERLLMYDGYPYSVSGKLTQNMLRSEPHRSWHACNVNPTPPPEKTLCTATKIDFVKFCLCIKEEKLLNNIASRDPEGCSHAVQ